MGAAARTASKRRVVSALFLTLVGSGGVYLAWSWYASEGDSTTSWQAGIEEWPVDLDMVLTRATAMVPNGTPLTFVLPYTPDQPFRFDAAVGGSTVRVLVDRRSGQVTSTATLPPPSFDVRATDWLSNAHYGRTFSYANRLLWLALGLMPLLLFATGVWMWWRVGRAGRQCRLDGGSVRPPSLWCSCSVRSVRSVTLTVRIAPLSIWRHAVRPVHEGR
jgi:hypothetical protein